MRPGNCRISWFCLGLGEFPEGSLAVTGGKEGFWNALKNAPSALVLIAANVLPLWQVVVGEWTAFDVVFLFWLENIIIGAFNVAKMLVAGAIGMSEAPQIQETPASAVLQWRTLRLLRLAGAVFMSAFFAFHYGMFCFVHGIFVAGLLGGGFKASGGPERFLFAAVKHAFAGDLCVPALVLLLSHGFSFAYNFVLGGEYKSAELGRLMGAPYGRVVVLHLAILLGAFAAMALGSNAAVLAVLVILKIVLDARLHLKEHGKFAKEKLSQQSVA